MKQLAIQRAIHAAENTVTLPEKKVQGRKPKHRFNKEGRNLKNNHQAKENQLN